MTPDKEATGKLVDDKGRMHTKKLLLERIMIIKSEF